MKTNTTKTNGGRAEAAPKPGPAQPGSIKTQPVKADVVKGPIIRNEPPKHEVPKPTPAKIEPVRTEPAKPAPSAWPAKTESVQAAKPDLAKSAPAKAPPIKAEAPKPAPAESHKPQTVKVESPKVNRVSLELVRPEAKQVCVAGTFNEWKPERTPLVKANNGRWVGNLTVNPGRYEYLFVVDGQWVPDPNARESVQNPFGGRNSVLVVSA